MTHVFINETVGGVRYTGHLLRLDNPSPETFSVLPPVNGCGSKAYTTETAAAGGCLASTNAGFFDVPTGACIGALVSKGQVLNVADKVHATFGLTDTGFFVGYLGPESRSVAGLGALGFSDLVSGAGWLVADGAPFVNESVAIEGIDPAFVAEPAPRLAIGHSALGELMIMEIDGNELFKQGPGLADLADLAIHFGFVNAVNLDGGGSDTVVLHGSLCSTCGALNQTCADIPTPPLPPAPPPSPAPSPDYMPCLKCGLADPLHTPAPHIPLCQRLVTSITCIHNT